jgi:uncharacterized RDD family membrane protein YckC
MARRAGDWLDGPAEPLPEGSWPGEALGLPREGPGTIAGTGSRLLALLIDLVVGGLVGAFVFSLLQDPDEGLRATLGTASFAAQLIVLQALTGQSIGMRLTRLRVVRLAAPSRPPGLLPVAIRTALLCLVVPAILSDADGRGLHDKAAGTAVLRA